MFESCMILVQIYQSNELTLQPPQRGLRPFCVFIAQRRTYFIKALEIQTFGRPFLYFYERAKGLLCGYCFSLIPVR